MVAKKVGVDYDMQTNKITNLGAPSGANDAARKDYVDTAVAGASIGLSWKQAVRAATTAAGTLATSFENGDTIDGVVLATGDRILIKDQAAPEENGIYAVAASGAPARTTDAGTAANILQAAVFVQEGTVNADKLFLLTTNAPITLGTTGLVFAQFSSGGGASLTVQEIDGTPIDTAVTIIRVTNGKLTDNGAGDVTLDLSGDSADGAGDAPFTAPVDGDFAWINQGSAVATVYPEGILLEQPNVGTGDSLAIRKKAAPSVPYVITARFRIGYMGIKNYHHFGLCFRQSSDGKLISWGPTFSTNMLIAAINFNSPTSASSTPVVENWPYMNDVWLRIADNNTNHIFSYSFDGRYWLNLGSVSRTAFLTAANEVGFFVDARNAAAPNRGMGVKLLSWGEA